MKSLAIFSVLVAVSPAMDTQLSQDAINTLTTIDSVPTQLELDQVFDGTTLAQQTLLQVAADPSNPGIRLRAIHALTLYCLVQTNNKCDANDPAHVTLTGLVTSYTAARAGTDLLTLRAAIEALGPLQVAGDEVQLAPLLDHPSRDIRAATAHALRDLCNTDAISPLRLRYQHETIDQVRLAISEALRILGQSPSPCVN